MIQLRPPTDADNYRVQAGRFGDRFYTDPLPADDTWGATSDDDIYPAISTVKKATGQDWSKAMAKRLAKAPSQLVEIGNLDSEFERKARLNLLSDAGLGKAGDRGTLVHQHAEALLMNRLPIYQMTDEVKPYIARLEDFFAAYHPVLVAAEFVAINRDLNHFNVKRGNEYRGYGGTGDAVVEIDGKLWLVDWKSRAEDGDHKAYAEEGAQVSAYGRADYWIVGCDESIHGARRIKPLDLAGGLIVSIKPDSYECFPIDLDEGFDYWTDLHAWWQARRSERRPIGRKWAPRVPVTSELAEESVTEDPPEVSSGQEAPTPESNRARFDALPPVKQGWARQALERKGLKPKNPATAGEVARILAEIENRPTLREAQETRAEQVAEHDRCPSCGAVSGTCGPPDSDHCEDAWHGPLPSKVDPMEAEGGPADAEILNESRLLFDMVIGDHGRKWAPRVPVTSELAELAEHDQAKAEWLAVQEDDEQPPTPESNRARFDALPPVKQGWARQALERKGLKPKNPATAGEVARILADIEQRPSLREAQETRAEQIDSARRAAHGVDMQELAATVNAMQAEGGAASDELVNESRVMFDLVIGDHGRKWTGLRVTEANDAGVGFQVSKLRSMKRAHLYLALTTWAAFRGEALLTDEAEGNVEFSSLLFLIDELDDAELALGYRLGSLTADEAERFAAEVASVVQSETGDELVTEPETQPTTT